MCINQNLIAYRNLQDNWGLIFKKMAMTSFSGNGKGQKNENYRTILLLKKIDVLELFILSPRLYKEKTIFEN
jgi:hypothetical protein